MQIEPDRAANSAFPDPGHSVLAQVIAAWDATLRELWSSDVATAHRAAASLYAPATTDGESDYREPETILCFQQELKQRTPQTPPTPEERYRAVVTAVGGQLHRVREAPTQPFVEDLLSVALRPVGRLGAGMLTHEICAALYDYHRGVWSPHQTRSQRLKIEAALANALACLPPDNLEDFWENLHSGNALMRGAMRLGLEWLTSDHAVPHLLCGLDRSTDSDTRFALVDNLARIGDPRALPRLYALRRTAALTDWPLARRISAAIGVIEHLNREQAHRSLLRPAQAPSQDPSTLLRPTAEIDPAPATLLRSADPTPPS
jgi:hypothetical protein